MGEIFMIPEQDESDASVKMYKILKDREKQNEGSKTNKSYILTDEEIIVKAFYDNAYKLDNWKDCCIAMIRDAMEMKKTQISKELKFDVDKLTLGDLKFAIEHSPYYAESILRAVSKEFMVLCREIEININK